MCIRDRVETIRKTLLDATKSIRRLAPVSYTHLSSGRLKNWCDYNCGLHHSSQKSVNTRNYTYLSHKKQAKKAGIHYKEILSQDNLSKLTSSIMLKKLNQLLLSLGIMLPLNMMAQNLISSGSPLYKLPYKNTYVMETLVAENSFRTAKVEKTQPGTFAQAKKVLPSPYWDCLLYTSEWRQCAVGCRRHPWRSYSFYEWHRVNCCTERCLSLIHI